MARRTSEERATPKPARSSSQPAQGKASAAAARRAAGEARRATAEAAGGFAPAGRPSDVFGGELRRRDIFSLLVLHLITRSEGGASYGNQLIERIEGLTRGIVSVNPNTMYPLLRELESRGIVRGYWEHPEKRSRRLYSVTEEGKAEYTRLMEAMEPFLDSIVESITLIKREVYPSGPARKKAAAAKKK
jgi:PadR family transcriptional regulator, regulatory protein PadR